jgi:type IV secretory pathway VirB3-like protein
MEEKELSFDSYNAMGRTATYAGVPQFVLLGIIFLGIIITAIACTLFSWYGLLALFIPVILFTVVRIACESDSRFLTRLRFMLGRYIRNMIYGRALLITPYNPRWEQFYGRRIAEKRFISRD